MLCTQDDIGGNAMVLSINKTKITMRKTKKQNLEIFIALFFLYQARLCQVQNMKHALLVGNNGSMNCRTLFKAETRFVPGAKEDLM